MSKDKQTNSFSVIKPLGRGAYSDCSLVRDDQGNEFVLKKPTGTIKLRTWIRNCRKEACITAHLPKKHYDVGQIHLSYRDKQWLVTSNLITGECLNQTVLNTLPPQEKQNVLESFAHFLFDLHTLPITRMNEHFSEPRVYNLTALWEKYFAFKKTYCCAPRHRNIFKRKKFLRKKAKIYRDQKFSAKQIQMTEDILTHIGKNAHVFKQSGVCYNDFHSGNIFYNRDKKRLCVLDFGSCSYGGSVYRDFAQIYEPHYGEDLTRELILIYNRLCIESGLKQTIDFDMVRYFAVTILFERLARYKDWNDRYFNALTTAHKHLSQQKSGVA